MSLLQCSAVIMKLMVFADNTYGAAVGDFSVERGHLEDRGQHGRASGVGEQL